MFFINKLGNETKALLKDINSEHIAKVVEKELQ